MATVGGANNVEKIVQTVLEKLAGLSVDRLPKSTFAKYINYVTRGLAQIQLPEGLLDVRKGNLTLCSDGTTKFGYSFGTFDISTATGESRVLRLGTGNTWKALQVPSWIL